jgi:hypothetical protein
MSPSERMYHMLRSKNFRRILANIYGSNAQNIDEVSSELDNTAEEITSTPKLILALLFVFCVFAIPIGLIVLALQY